MHYIQALLTIIFLFSLIFCGCSFLAIRGSRIGGNCTVRTEGTLTKIVEEHLQETPSCYYIEYMAGDELIKNQFPIELVEGLTLRSEIGTRVTVWFNPENPKQAVVGEDPLHLDTLRFWLKVRRKCIIAMMISVVLLAVVTEFVK